MIKLLSKKIVACICLVLTVFAVSTSVLATDYELPASVNHVTIDTLADDSILLTAPEDYSCEQYNIDTSKYLYWRRDLYSWKKDGTYNSIYYKIFMIEGYDSFVICNYYSEYAYNNDNYGVYLLCYNSETGEFLDMLYGYSLESSKFSSVDAGGNSGASTFYTQSNCKLYYSTTDYYVNGNPVSSIEPGTLIADFESLNQVSTDFSYKFEAETKNRLALTITDLDSSYKMIGFVDNPTTYEVGDVLSAGIDIAYQRITPRRFR